MKQKQKVPASSKVFYVISVILLVVFAFQIYYQYVNMKAYDLDFATQWKDIFYVYLGQCVLPFIGAVVTYGMGLILAKLSTLEVATVATENVVSADEEAMVDLVSSLKEVKAESKTKKTEEKTEEETKAEKKTKPVAKKAPAKKEEETVVDSNVEAEMPKDKVEA